MPRLNPDTQRILVLGGGFGGVYAALGLEKHFLRDDTVEIVLVSEENFLLFTPMLPEVASGSIEAKHIVSPVRAFFRKVKFHNSGVQRIDLERRRVFTRHCPACGQQELQFDHLVLALGSTTRFYGLPGVAQHALPMKTLSDAMVLRNRVIDRFEHANMESDAEVRKILLTFVIAGGGFAGTETVAELRDFAHTARAYYPNIHPDEINVVLVHSGTRIMPEISADLAEYALGKLRQKGVDVRLQTGVRSATADCVELTTNEKIRARTLVWSAGTSPSPLLAELHCPRNTRGQIIVNECLEVPGHPGVWALGDCAEVPNPQSGRPHPPTAQHAVRQGKIVARNIRAALGGGKKMAFAFAPIGVLASLGRRSAVAEIYGFKFSGFFAWWLWRTIYLFKLPGLERKLRVAGDWTLDLFFPRDITLLKLFTSSAPDDTVRDVPDTPVAVVVPASR